MIETKAPLYIALADKLLICQERSKRAEDLARQLANLCVELFAVLPAEEQARPNVVRGREVLQKIMVMLQQ